MIKQTERGSVTRKTLIVITLIILFVMSGTSAVVLALVEIAPVYPEEKLFPIQDKLEHALLIFYPDTTSKSWYELKILDKRVKDLEKTEDLSEEVARINSVWVEVDHVLKQFQIVTRMQSKFSLPLCENPEQHTSKNGRFTFLEETIILWNLCKQGKNLLVENTCVG